MDCLKECENLDLLKIPYNPTSSTEELSATLRNVVEKCIGVRSGEPVVVNEAEDVVQLERKKEHLG